jgi:hypothetical protein
VTPTSRRRLRCARTAWSSGTTTSCRPRASRAELRSSPASTRRCTGSRRLRASRRAHTSRTSSGSTLRLCRRWASGSAPAATTPTTRASGTCRRRISSSPAPTNRCRRTPSRSIAIPRSRPCTSPLIASGRTGSGDGSVRSHTGAARSTRRRRVPTARVATR